MGSGSLNAYSLIETGYRDDLSLKEATQLAINAIKAGIIYDNGSGSNVDFVQITKEGTNYVRNHEIVGKRMIPNLGNYKFQRENIPRLGRRVIPLNKVEEEPENLDRIIPEEAS